MVDPGALPHEEVAAVEEHVQADECKHAVEAKAETMLLKVKIASLVYHKSMKIWYLKAVIIHA